MATIKPVNEKMSKEIKKLVAEIAEVPVKDVKDNTNFFDDLGVDSMKALEIVAVIEKKYKIVIPEAKIPTIKSVRNIYPFIEKALKKK